MARSSDARSARSPTTISASSCRRLRRSECSRTSVLTCQCSRSSARATAEPTKPVAPVTNALMKTRTAPAKPQALRPPASGLPLDSATPGAPAARDPTASAPTQPAGARAAIARRRRRRAIAALAPAGCVGALAVGSRAAGAPGVALSSGKPLAGGRSACGFAGAVRVFMRALVTGATGFVGSAVARALLREHWQVRTLVREHSDRRNLRQLEAEIVVGDLADRASLDRAIGNCQALFHVAADYRLGAREPAQLYRTNVEGSRNILEAARQAGVGRIVYTSSVATIGIPADGSPGREDTPVALTDMIGHYKRSKFLAEELVCESARAGTSVVIVNPSTPIGAGDVKPTPTGRMVLDAACGRMPAYVDTGLNIVHVDDVAEGHLAAFHHGRIGERYILGGQDMTLREILAQIALLVGRKPPRIRLPHT